VTDENGKGAIRSGFLVRRGERPLFARQARPAAWRLSVGAANDGYYFTFTRTGSR
jgi:hypothetical protein